MPTDPGWGPAYKYGLLAILSRSRVMKVRPAITAARAGTVGFLYTALAVLGVLTSLGESEEPDYLFTGAILAAGAVAATVGATYFRYRPPKKVRVGSSPVEHLLAMASVVSAFAAVPMLMGFVTFFLGGGFLMYWAGLVWSLVLLLGPFRPSEDMVRGIAERLDPPVDPDTLWQEILQPAT